MIMKLLVIALLCVTLSAECILIMTKNSQMSRYFAQAFHEAGFRTKVISKINPKMDIGSDTAALSVVRQSGCAYALYMPISMKSSNVSGEADFSGKLKVYRENSGYFETINWSEQASSDIIELQDDDAPQKIKKRFVKFTSAKAIEYFIGKR